MLRRLALFFAVLLTLAAGQAVAQVAYVHDMTGSVTAAANGAAPRALKIGDTLVAGTTVTTGAASTAVIKFEDGQIVALTQQSSFRITDYRYNKARPREGSVVLNVLRGGLRFITGVIGSSNRGNVRVNVGTATIGIRGTDVTLYYDLVAQTVTAAVNAGEVAMATAQGTQSIGPGTFSSVVTGQAPSAPAPTAQAIAAVAQVLNNLAAQGIPINTPVVIDASARAAAAAANARQLAAQAAAQPGNTALQQAAQAAGLEAQNLLQTAIGAAQDALKTAVDNGAILPPPPAPPTGPTGDTGAPPTGTTGSTSSPTGAGGAGGGGTGTTTPPPCDPQSASNC
jgi:hypothetical protein